MSDREKAIKGLQCCKSPNDHEHCPYNTGVHYNVCTYRLLSDALELLKLQEPKPVKVTKNTYNYKFYNCPNCDRGFEDTFYKRPAFCDKCGQAVKWE